MVSELITLPLRAGVRVVRLSLYTAEEALRLTTAVGDQIIKAVRPQGSENPPAPSPEPERPQRPSAPAAPARPGRRPVAPAPAPAPPPAPTRAPAHVSADAVLVEEVAESGAAEGAGAEVHVEAPWAEYGQMAAKDIMARLEQASPAELAAVQLYERTHRARQTVLEAAERRLRADRGRGPQPRDERKSNHG